jgi:hypothetical protein
MAACSFRFFEGGDYQPFGLVSKNARAGERGRSLAPRFEQGEWIAGRDAG